MSKKLIYISFIKITDKVARDWYIDHCIAKGALVEYWDIVSLVREEHVENYELNADYLRNIKNYKEFEALVCQPENKDAVYVMLISYSGRFSKPYRLLSKYSCKMVFLNWGAMPTTSSAPKWQKIIYRLFNNPFGTVKTVADVILGNVYRNLNVVNRFDIVFAAGHALTSVDQYAKRVVPFNICDFDHYSRVKLADKKIVNGKYAVFLDINLPYQSDLAIHGLSALNPVSYFKSLNKFFDLLEETHGLKVVVAEHPKANYIDDEFMQRESHRMLTAELVKDAVFVITHTSTALSYAVLNLKPVLFIYTNEMMDIYKNTVIREIDGLASYLNSKVYNIDNITNSSNIMISDPDRKQYNSYKYNYLTSQESERFFSFDIFWQEISLLLN
jgi:hypothetical protein